MNKLFIIIFLLVAAGTIQAQNKRIDSLIAKIDHFDNVDDARIVVNQVLAIPHGDYALLKKQKQNLANAEAEKNIAKQLFALQIICDIDLTIDDLPGLLNTSLKGIRLSQTNHSAFDLSRFLLAAGTAYSLTQDDQIGFNYSLKAVSVATEARDTIETITILSIIESDYAYLKKPDSALYYVRRELQLITQYSKPNKRDMEPVVMSDMGEAFNVANQLDSALIYCHKSLSIDSTNRQVNAPFRLNIIAEIFLKKAQTDSALQYALKSYSLASKAKRWDFTADACALLSKIYEGRDDKKSLYYLKALMAANDSSRSSANSKQFQLIADRDQQYDQELQDAREKFNARVHLYVVVGTAFVLLLIGIFLWRNYRRQKQNNFLLNEQKEEIAAQRDNLGITLEKLKTTQTQLIQSEKMASLGELTAGIAHEIQNPLNFVNNFSEVNTELISEMKAEIDKGDLEEIKAIATDIEENSKKINLHGKRADAIVKGMLQHSQSGNGTKEPTNINVLADEYLRLSYHGLCSKDKGFNADMVTHFAENLPQISVIPQDIGRVMLNLFNNAFYAVNQKKKTAAAGYKPEVTVTTSAENGQVVIKVKDNGNGIPDAVKDKIMQPFFTTKPTGEGTGLGLSLSYDIVVKGYGGSIQVNSFQGEGAEFIITVPIS